MGSDDEAAEFCAVVGPQIIGLLTLQCGDPDVAEDLAQQTLARLFMRWNRLRDVETCAPTHPDDHERVSVALPSPRC